MTPPEYPPGHFVETDPARLHAVIDAFGLAVLASPAPDDVLVTHLPLALERDRGPLGTLVGHLDRTNPQSDLLDGRPVVAVFRGPDAYISPTVYASSQLPTWNYIAVHARGTARTMRSTERLKASLIEMARRLEGPAAGFVLHPDDERMARLLGDIVGFEIEITGLEGRFKLSQDKSDADRARARDHLLAESRARIERFMREVV